MSRLEKLKREAINEANIRVLNEMNEPEIIDGYTCGDAGGDYVACSKVDKYGYVIRVFKGDKEEWLSSGKLPNKAEFQGAGKTWEEAVKAYEINARKRNIEPTSHVEKPKRNE